VRIATAGEVLMVTRIAVEIQEVFKGIFAICGQRTTLNSTQSELCGHGGGVPSPNASVLVSNTAASCHSNMQWRWKLDAKGSDTSSLRELQRVHSVFLPSGP